MRFFSYMVLEQGALTSRYSPAHPLPEGSSRAAVYNGILPQPQALADAADGDTRGSWEHEPTNAPRPRCW